MKISYLQPPRAQTNLNPKTQKSILRDPQLSSKARFCPPGSGLSPFSKQKKKVSLKQLPQYIIGTNKEDVQQFKTGSVYEGFYFYLIQRKKGSRKKPETLSIIGAGDGN